AVALSEERQFVSQIHTTSVVGISMQYNSGVRGQAVEHFHFIIQLDAVLRPYGSHNRTSHTLITHGGVGEADEGLVLSVGVRQVEQGQLATSNVTQDATEVSFAFRVGVTSVEVLYVSSQAEACLRHDRTVFSVQGRSDCTEAQVGASIQVEVVGLPLNSLAQSI